MQRLLLILWLALAAPAYAQDNIETATARVMIEALAPSSYGDWAYDWSAVSIRVSRHMHWHLPDPDPRGRPEHAEVRRTGWIGASGAQVGVAALGAEYGVRLLAFNFGGGDDRDALFAALHAAGAQIDVVSESNRSGRYVLAAPERDAAILDRTLSCTPPGSRAARRCWTDYTLTFPGRGAPG